MQPEKLTLREDLPLKLSQLTLRKAVDAITSLGFCNGEQMRFHKAESAFFVFIFVILAAGLVTLHAYGLLQALAAEITTPAAIEKTTYLNKLLFGTGVLLATALFFGIFFIYPLIRKQATEEGKLRAMTVSLSARSETLEHAALTDGLTGMQNRRYFDDALKEYLEEFRRIDKPVGLMILDLDHFKQVNDTHGHDVGDQVLRAVANCLKDMTRYHDVVARLGGEEFAVVTPNMDAELLSRFAERIRKAIANMSILSGNVRLKITTSVGLAIWDRKETAEEFYRRADRQLYEAKRQGRNRVCA
ncbi:diguanylate cyclase (GGDEF) domain-containing protein [Mesorhizobium muleiense]|uniref:diguanylate cyclase n=5 Tax=Phyllobacteriaceae TaxID=69277 RepID=A0A1G8UXM2_9HYPH|nr:diguanylate cyclase (GGDEF) domain-containing protein [Mesorhizobium muleiense]